MCFICKGNAKQRWWQHESLVSRRQPSMIGDMSPTVQWHDKVVGTVNKWKCNQDPKPWIMKFPRCDLNNLSLAFYPLWVEFPVVWTIHNWQKIRQDRNQRIQSYLIRKSSHRLIIYTIASGLNMDRIVWIGIHCDITGPTSFLFTLCNSKPYIYPVQQEAPLLELFLFSSV
jgi:hypothetical protein